LINQPNQFSLEIASDPFRREKHPRIASWGIFSRTARWDMLTQDYGLLSARAVQISEQIGLGFQVIR